MTTLSFTATYAIHPQLPTQPYALLALEAAATRWETAAHDRGTDPVGPPDVHFAHLDDEHPVIEATGLVHTQETTLRPPAQDAP